MFRFKRWLLCAVLGLTPRLGAQPALTTIQDILYMADGNRFSGVVTIAWQSFEAGDTSNIGAQVTRLAISNGNLFVQLVPTTTSSTPATYAVQYNSSGHTQFSEVWVVPPSITPLRVRDVRLGPGVVSTPGPASQSTTVQIADVLGLQSALNLRPTMGSGYGPARAAIINGMGGLDGAVGAMADCIHVDGTSGPCGSGNGSNAVFVDAEIPGGTQDGVNTSFALQNGPNPPLSLALYRNGLLQKQGFDYTLSGSTVTFQTGSIPRPNDTLLAYYRLAAGLPGVGFVDAETPAGAVDGVNNSFTLAQTPIPSLSLELYRNGIRLKSGIDYMLSNNAISFVTAMIPQSGDVLLCSYRIAQ